jgi:hypothetical protein
MRFRALDEHAGTEFAWLDEAKARALESDGIPTELELAVGRLSIAISNLRDAVEAGLIPPEQLERLAQELGQVAQEYLKERQTSD